MAINNKTGDAQDALIDFLVGALRPFVKHWEPWMDDPHHGDDDYMSSFARVQFKDVRRARAALLASSVAAPVATPAPAVDAVPAGEVEQCSFVDCPPGLFRWNGLLCFKSEYSTKAGQPDAYCVDSGEYFWGGTSGDLEKRRNLMVQPVASAALSHGEGRK